MTSFVNASLGELPASRQALEVREEGLSPLRDLDFLIRFCVFNVGLELDIMYSGLKS